VIAQVYFIFLTHKIGHFSSPHKHDLNSKQVTYQNQTSTVFHTIIYTTAHKHTTPHHTAHTPQHMQLSKRKIKLIKAHALFDFCGAKLLHGMDLLMFENQGRENMVPT